MSSKERKAPAKAHRGPAPNQPESQPCCADLCRIKPSDSSCCRREVHRYSGGSTSSLPHSIPAVRIASSSLHRRRQSSQPFICVGAAADKGAAGCSSSTRSHCAHWVGLMGSSFHVATCLA